MKKKSIQTTPALQPPMEELELLPTLKKIPDRFRSIAKQRILHTGQIASVG
jgi:hypothetical protein